MDIGNRYLQKAATLAEQLSIRANPSVIELFNQQQPIQRDTNTFT